MTVKMQLVLLILIFVISITTIVMVILKSIMSVTEDRTIKYSEDIIRQMELNIHKYTDDTHRIAKAVAYNKQVQKFLLAKDMSELLEIETEMSSFMENAKMLKENIEGITIFFKDSHISYGTLANVDKLDDLDDFVMNDVKESFYTHSIQKNHTSFYFYIVPIYDTEVGEAPLQRIGTEVITLNINNFTRLFEQFDLLPNSIILILDNMSRVVACNEKKLVNTVFDKDFIEGSTGNSLQDVVYDKGEYIMQRKDITELGWSIYTLLPKKELLGDIAPVIRLTLIIGILELVFSIVISIFIIKGITNPIKQITGFAAKVGYGNVKERLGMVLHNELRIVVLCINNMLDQVEEMTRRIFNTQEKLYKSELNERQAELNALQSQINPHFLYNTLECIRSIAEVYEVNEIIDISVSMSDIFRYSIKQSDIVRIRDEIECVKNYFRIIDIRFKGRFQMNLECDDSILDCSIIKMILQPLVENAVYHGLEAKRGRGNVYIRICHMEGDIIEFIVKDDGIGIKEDSLKKFALTLSQDQQDELDSLANKRSIGLLNINNRIRNYYGDQYGLSIESEENIGTLVALKIPQKGGVDVV